MTADEIRALPAGRELDALIAERVLGWAHERHLLGTGTPEDPFRWDSHTAAYEVRPEMWPDGTPMLASGRQVAVNLPEYSTDITAAWQVVESMTEIRRSTTGANTRFMRLFQNADLWADSAAEAALEICHIALLALEPRP